MFTCLNPFKVTVNGQIAWEKCTSVVSPPKISADVSINLNTSQKALF